MLRRIEIEGFRGFKKLSVDLGEITGIVGKNSSGKSSLLQAVRLACDALELALASPSSSPVLKNKSIEVCSGLVVTDPSRLSSLSEWRQLFTDEIGPGKTFLRISLVLDEFSAIDALSVKLSSGRNAQLLLDVSVESQSIAARASAFPAKSKKRTSQLREDLRQARPTSIFVPAFYGVTSREEHRSRPLVNRLLGSGDQSHIVRNLVSRLDANGFERLNSFLKRTLGAELLSRTTMNEAENVESLRVTFRDTNGELEISAAGTGLIAMVALYAAMDSVRASRLGSPLASVPTFLLDEPEAHLHPRLQGNVAEELVKLAREFGFQMALATHSVEMINRLGRLGARLLSVDRVQDRVVELEDDRSVIGALEDIADLEPFTALNMLASRRIIFHEGPSDYAFLDACARLLFRVDDDRMREWRRFVPCSLDGSGNAGAASTLVHTLSPKVFPKLAGDPVLVALLLDRDYTRTPGLKKRTEGGGALTLVESTWTRHSIESLFLDAPLLAGWISDGKQDDETQLRADLESLIAFVDKDQKLEDAAIDGRTTFWRRADADHKALTDREATKQARNEVREAPAVFHRGKDRARRILEGLRKMARWKGLRGSLEDIVSRADPNKLGDPGALIPPDILKLLNMLIPPGTVRGTINLGLKGLTVAARGTVS